MSGEERVMMTVIVIMVTRLMMTRVSDTDIEVTLMRGGRVGDKCSVTLGTDGMINKVPPHPVK